MDYLIQSISVAIISLEKDNNQVVPILYQLIASFLFSLNSYLVKILTNVSSAEIILYRSIITLIINGSIVMQLHMDCYPNNKSTYRKLIFRGIAGSIGVSCLFYGIKLLPLSEGMVLFRTTPLWTTLIVVFVMKQEKFSKIQMVNVLFCFFGICLIARPPFINNIFGYFGFQSQIESQLEWEHHTLGVILCLITSILSTGVQILISSLSKEINQFAILQYFSFFGLILSSFQLIFMQPSLAFEIPNINDSLLILLLGVIGCIGQWLMNRSFFKGNLTTISTVGQSQVVFSFLFDIFILKQQFQTLSLMGIGIVIICLLISINRVIKIHPNAIQSQNLLYLPGK